MSYTDTHFNLVRIGAKRSFGSTQDIDYKQDVSKVLVGIDYRFDWGRAPIVAKY